MASANAMSTHDDQPVAIDACWNRIGVNGDRSCSELVEHLHCRNCSTFGSAAARLLDRDIPADTDYFQPGPDLNTASEQAARETVAIFRLGAEWFALPTTALDEIIATRQIHTLPHRRHPALLGLANIRGQLVICISMIQLLLGLPPVDNPSRMVVLRHGGDRFAFPVDEVQHTHQYSRADLRPVPSTVARSASSYADGLIQWQDRTIARLDDKLLFEGLNRCLA